MTNGLNNFFLSTHEFGSRGYLPATYCLSCPLVWVSPLPDEEGSTDIYYSPKSGLEATGPLPHSRPGVEPSDSHDPRSSLSVQLPSVARLWGLMTTICFRAITRIKKIKSYKLSNRRNMRTGQNGQILNHAWNALSPLQGFRGIQLRPQKVWVKCQVTSWGFASTGAGPVHAGGQELWDSVQMLLLHFPCLQSSSVRENSWKGFLVWVVSLWADLLFQDIFLMQRKCNRKPAAY